MSYVYYKMKIIYNKLSAVVLILLQNQPNIIIMY